MLATQNPWWLGVLMLLLAAFDVLLVLAFVGILIAFPIIAVRHLLWLRRERQRA